FVGTHLLAAQAVIHEKADLGFVFNETWNSLNETSKKMLEVVGQTRNGDAYHCFCVSPSWAEKRGQLQAVLCGMKDDPKGKRVLDELGFSGFEAVAENALDSLVTLMQEPGK
ncbi:MAG: phosphate/phosphite/phosphonate ABC transporter substrate-binding protein, partial [Chlorobiales bacterium]|nr:phosphate/phosphite/phosphonate ABC transporter substrate-binding protein [Chlorobiales bacterium]